MQPGAGFGSAVLGPDIAEKQYQLAQRQAYAQALLQQGMDPLQGQNVGGHYVAPSWTQGLAKALGGYMGAKAMADMPQQQQELQQLQNSRLGAAFGLGAPSQGPQAFPVGQGDAQPQPSAQAMGTPQIPLLPGRSAQESFMVAQNVGLPAYFKMVGEQGNTMTDIQKNLKAQGIQPGTPQWNAALAGNLEKQNYIAPPSAAPGATLIDPRTGQPMFNAPQNGMQLQYGPDGVAVAKPVQGYGNIIAKQEGDKARATAGANAEFDLVEVPNPSGQGSTYMTRAQLAQQAQSGNAPQAKPDPRTGKADTIISLAAEAGDILKNASNGLVGSLKTSAADTAGFSTKESQADARLKVISGQLVMNMPRMEGPQSDADRLLYQQMAGDIANPRLPRETRAAALQTMTDLQQKYATPQPSARPAQNSSVASPRSAQEMQALPSGTVFRAPDGSIRRVP
ncbi:hypothetical protein D3C87_792780 [compost metagenome]